MKGGLLVLVFWLAMGVWAAPAAWGQADDAKAAASVDEVLNAVVHVHAKIPLGARSAGYLGTEREGSGVLIDAEGYIITVGYIVLEASTIDVETAAGVKSPAFLVAYDSTYGFGLLRSAVPLKTPPVAFGDSGKLKVQDPLAIISYGQGERIAPAVVASRRTFVGYWEYMLDNAIFTVPPTGEYAGAALVSQEYKLVGIGSLFVRDSLADGGNLPGNMFLPIDALKPILSNLKRLGRTDPVAKPWLGVFVVEQFGRVLISDVSNEGPAQRAGLEAGDIILGINESKVVGLAGFYRSLWAQGPAGVTVHLQILRGSDVRAVNVTSMDRYQHFRQQGMN